MPGGRCTTHDGVDFAALPLQLDGDRTIADLYEQGQAVGDFTLPMPGLHNLSNTIAALAACRMEGVPFERLISHLETLKTPGRRFDCAAPGRDATSLTTTPIIPVR